MSDARKFESDITGHASKADRKEARQLIDEAEQAHHDMMRAIFADANV